MLRFVVSTYCVIFSFISIAYSAQIAYIQDTTINEKICLWNNTLSQCNSIENIMMDSVDLSSYINIEDTIKLDINAKHLFGNIPYTLVYNDLQTEFLIATPYYGTCSQCWRAFYFGYLNSTHEDSNNHPFVICSERNFYTESGIHLGMTEEELFELKGTQCIKNGNIITYHYISSDIYADEELFSWYTTNNIGNMFLHVSWIMEE